MIWGLLALAGAAIAFAVSATTGAPDVAAPTSQMTALFLVVAVGCLGPIVARVAAGILGPPLARLSPVGGFLASSNLRTATRRFSSASTPLVLSVAMSCTLLFSSTTIDHAVTQERHAGLSAELAVTSAGPGIPRSALSDVRATPGVEQVGYRQIRPSAFWSLSEGVVRDPPYDSFDFSGASASATLDISENAKGEKTLRMYYLPIGRRLSRAFVDQTRAMMDAAYANLRARIPDLPPAEAVEEKLVRVPPK